jgi:phage terminase large subunit
MGGIKIHKAYQPLITSDKRYFFLTGGRASLKSTTIHDFASRLTYERGHGVLVTRYTMASAEKSIIPEFKSSISLNGSEGDFHKAGNVFTNKHTGSFILFSGIKTNSGDQTANLKSLHGITTWIIDEGEDFNDERTFDDIDDSIRGSNNKNRVIWIQNPTTKEHFIYKRWVENHVGYKEIDGEQVVISNHPDVEPIHTTYHIAEQLGYLSKSFLNKVNRIKKENPTTYKHKYLGGWLDKAEGVIFKNWKLGDFDKTLPVIYGQDYGFANDPSTLVKVAVDRKKNKIFLDECIYKQHLTTSDLVVLNKKYAGNNLIIGDSAEPRLIEEMKREGVNIKPSEKGADSIRIGIARMLDFELIVTPDSTNLIKELNNYAWNDRKSGVPIDNHNHIIDAVRYSLEKLIGKPTKKIYAKVY